MTLRYLHAEKRVVQIIQVPSSQLNKRTSRTNLPHPEELQPRLGTDTYKYLFIYKREVVVHLDVHNLNCQINGDFIGDLSCQTLNRLIKVQDLTSLNYPLLSRVRDYLCISVSVVYFLLISPFVIHLVIKRNTILKTSLRSFNQFLCFFFRF